ncbi:MAG TPA: Imm32 family immunity protein [Pyrinomonadaceae bacterium]|jgi:hypothetical protein
MGNDYLLAFELNKDKDELEIFTDSSGLKLLIEELNKLLNSAEKGNNDHTHLMTEDWGGNELTSKAQSGEVLNHVKIHCLNKN